MHAAAATGQGLAVAAATVVERRAQPPGPVGRPVPITPDCLSDMAPAPAPRLQRPLAVPEPARRRTRGTATKVTIMTFVTVRLGNLKLTCRLWFVNYVDLEVERARRAAGAFRSGPDSGRGEWPRPGSTAAARVPGSLRIGPGAGAF